eukprot:jgi/Psemu1/54365/gm1.54365_g
MSAAAQLRAAKQAPFFFKPVIRYEDYPTVHLVHSITRFNTSAAAAASTPGTGTTPTSLPPPPPPILVKKQDTTFCPDAIDTEHLIRVIVDFINAIGQHNLNIKNDAKHYKLCEVVGGNLKHTWDEIVSDAGTRIQDTSDFTNNLNVFISLFLPSNAFLIQQEYMSNATKTYHMNCLATAGHLRLINILSAHLPGSGGMKLFPTKTTMKNAFFRLMLLLNSFHLKLLLLFFAFGLNQLNSQFQKEINSCQAGNSSSKKQVTNSMTLPTRFTVSSLLWNNNACIMTLVKSLVNPIVAPHTTMMDTTDATGITTIAPNILCYRHLRIRMATATMRITFHPPPHELAIVPPKQVAHITVITRAGTPHIRTLAPTSANKPHNSPYRMRSSTSNDAHHLEMGDDFYYNHDAHPSDREHPSNDARHEDNYFHDQHAHPDTPLTQDPDDDDKCYHQDEPDYDSQPDY